MDHDLHRLAARMLCAGFRPEERTDFDALLAAGVGGAVLFARNIGATPSDVAALVADLKRRAESAGHALYLAIDQEGGRVRRLREGFAPIPSMRAVGERSDAELARDVGRLMGTELRAVGIDVDFAPVVDVDTNPANPVIADRSFSRDQAAVCELGTAVIAGLQERGVAACCKHFPGHGDTHQDSHRALPRLDHDLARLEAVELPPFGASVRAGVAGVMTAHVIFSPLDAQYPATMSRPVLHGLLRERLGFEGVIFSDDLEMAAVADHYGIEEAVRRGLEAGVDAFLVCHTPAHQRQAMAVIVSAVESGGVSVSRLRQSVARLDRLVAQYARPAGADDAGLLSSGAHRAWRDSVLSRLPSADASAPDPTRMA